MAELVKTESVKEVPNISAILFSSLTVCVITIWIASLPYEPPEYIPGPTRGLAEEQLPLVGMSAPAEPVSDVEALQQLLHFDIGNAVLMLAALASAWAVLRKTVGWHSGWIKRHEDDHRRSDDTMAELRVITVKLAAIAESQNDRLHRLESWRDRA